MKILYTILFISLGWSGTSGQTLIHGTVHDQKNNPLPGANIFIKNSYDGTTADSLGHFSFKTDLSEPQTLLATFIGYQPFFVVLNPDAQKSFEFSIILKESDDQIGEVVINAGVFEASDEKKGVTMRVFDIATTPSAQGDIFGALATLPGSQKVGEDGRIFVRGGESYETKTYMDGMLVATPYSSKMPDMPTRGRFSALLFSGTLFSTGAYSAEYGQALSSVVDMKTNPVETEEKSSISLLTVGTMGSTTRCWKGGSLSFNGDYMNSGLSNKINRQKADWIKTPESVDGTIMLRQKTGKTGMLKFFGNFSHNTSGIDYHTVSTPGNQRIFTRETNVYTTVIWNGMMGENWLLQAGTAWNFDHQKLDMNADRIINDQKMIQTKLLLNYQKNEKLSVKTGADWIGSDYGQYVRMNGYFRLPFRNNQLSAFGETEYKLSKKVAARFGLRFENNSLIRSSTLAPCFSGAYKTGAHSQISLACGAFYQNPENDYLKFAPQLKPEKARHLVGTWQYQTEQKTLRIESYLKKYDDLVKYTVLYAPHAASYSNKGNGQAEGVDIFWRDKKSINLTDYWISYSWINARRNYKDFQEEAVPNFISEHNLSVVAKRFFQPLRTYASVTYSFASSRPYHNPNLPGFMNARTKNYNDISLSLTYITELFGRQSVVHLMANNLAGFDNVFGYNFSSTPNANGIYDASPIKSPFVRQVILLVSMQL